MGNDNKVIHDGELRVQSPEVQLFLKGNTLISGNDRPATYNLEDEFTNSKKNRSWFILIAMIVAVVVVVTMTVAISKYIDHQNKQITVGIDVFEDLNLKKLLDVVTRTETALNSVISEKSSLERDKQAELNALTEKRDSDLFLVDSSNIKSTEKQARKLQIEEQYQIDCVAVEQKYDALIADADTRIAEYQKQLSDLDGKNVAMAQEQKAAIDSQRQLFEIEKQKIIDDYEAQLEDLRNQLVEARTAAVSQQRSAVGEIADDYKRQISSLDPVVVNLDGQAIIDQLASNEPYTRFTDQEFDYDLLPEEFSNGLENMRSTLDDFDKVWAVVASVPQENTIPTYVKALKSLAYKSGMELGQSALLAADTLNKEYQAEFDRLNTRLNDTTKQLAVTKEELSVTKENLATTKENLAATEENLIATKETLTTIETELSTSKLVSADFAEKAASFKAQSEYLSSTVDELNKATDYFNASTMTGISSGYILSIATSDKAKAAGVPDGAVLIYVNPVYSDIINGLKAYVYRSQNQLVGEVVCRVADGFFYAECVDGSNSTTLCAGDYLVPDLTSK